MNPKDPLPSGCGIEDKAQSSVTTPANKQSSNLVAAINKLTSKRSVQSSKRLEIMQGKGEDAQYELVKHIGTMTEQISVHEHKITDLGVQAKSILAGSGCMSDKKRMLVPVLLEAKRQCKLVVTLNGNWRRFKSG